MRLGLVICSQSLPLYRWRLMLIKGLPVVMVWLCLSILLRFLLGGIPLQDTPKNIVVFGVSIIPMEAFVSDIYLVAILCLIFGFLLGFAVQFIILYVFGGGS